MYDTFKTKKKFNVQPTLWRETIVIAILKPSKPDNPKNYRSISLLSFVNKIFERVLLTRIQMRIEEALPAEQAGFRQERCCSEQVLSMNTFIEK